MQKALRLRSWATPLTIASFFLMGENRLLGIVFSPEATPPRR
jgi:hypothetical protein